MSDDVQPVAEAAKPVKAARKPKGEPVPFVAAPATFPSDMTDTQLPAAAVSADPAHEDTTMDTSTISNAAETMTDRAKALFGDSNGRAKAAAEKGQQFFHDAVEFNKGNIEAMVESTKIAVRGFETMSQDAAAYARKSFEETSAAVKTLAQTKSPTEFAKLQGDYARSAFDAMVAHGSRSAESMLKLAGEIAQPFSNRFAVAADKFKVAA